MIYSNDRKLALSGWLQKNYLSSYNSPLKLQKYLFLYEAFSELACDETDFSKLKGYKNGPVFSTVFGDYEYRREEFDSKTLKVYNSGSQNIDELRAKRCGFIVSSLSEKELSELTHQFNIWKSKADRIKAGEKQVDLYKEDFNNADYSLVKMLKDIYTDEIINNSTIVPVCEKYFVFSKDNSKQFTEQHLDTLYTLAEQDDLHNPVFVEIEESGGLCVD